MSSRLALKGKAPFNEIYRLDPLPSSESSVSPVNGMLDVSGGANFDQKPKGTLDVIVFLEFQTAFFQEKCPCSRVFALLYKKGPF